MEVKLEINKYIEHLQGMVRFPTISKYDPNAMDLNAYFGLHNYLENAYPLIHTKMKKTMIGRAGLFYELKGNGTSKNLPLLLMAHQDVVPEGDHSLWKYPPFSATLADGKIWGRGCFDSKVNIMAYMEALEMLLAQGFTPNYDLYFSFGYNEEIVGGPEPAQKLAADYCLKRGLRFGLVIDEMGGFLEKNGNVNVMIGIAEPGSADFEFASTDRGGHSSTGGETALTRVCRTACSIHDNQPPVCYSKSFLDFFKTLSPRACSDPYLKSLLEDPEKNFSEICELLKADPTWEHVMHTTTAITMAEGSKQANVKPTRAWIALNNRLKGGDTVERLNRHYADLLPPDIEITMLSGHNPPPIQSVNTTGYKLIHSIFKNKYPTAEFSNIMLGGCTDRRFFCGKLCPTKAAYNCTGMNIGMYGNGHMPNEFIDVRALSDNVEFFSELLLKYGDAE